MSENDVFYFAIYSISAAGAFEFFLFICSLVVLFCDIRSLGGRVVRLELYCICFD